MFTPKNARGINKYGRKCICIKQHNLVFTENTQFWIRMPIRVANFENSFICLISELGK